MAEEEVGLRTSLKDRAKTARGLAEIEGRVDRVGRSAETAGRRAAIGARGFNSLRRAGRLAAVGVGAAFTATIGLGYGLLRLVQSSFTEAREAQKVGALTMSTIKATGRAAHVSAVQVENLAGRLSEMAGVDDELIQTGSNLLLTFKNIRNEQGRGNKIFNQATKSALDLSATPFYNGNMVGASKALGKALNDPLKGITALSKAGVQFSPVQIDTIKNLVAQNDLLGAQKIILKEVNSQVGGAAKSQRTWGAAASTAVKNVEERLGTDLLPMLDRFNRWFVKDGSDQLDRYLGIFETKGVPAIDRFTRKAIPLTQKYLPMVGDHLKDIGNTVGFMAPKLLSVMKAFNGLPSWAKSAIGIGIGAAAVGSKLGGVSSILGSRKLGGSGILGAISKAKPLPVLVTNPGFAAGTATGGRRGGAAIPVTGGDSSADDRRRRRTNAAKGLGIAGLVVTLSNPDDLKEAAGVLKDNAHAWGDVIKDNRLGNTIADKLRSRRTAVGPDPWASGLPANPTITDNMIAKHKYMADQYDRLATSSPRVAAGYKEEAINLAHILAVGQKTQPFMDSLFQDTVVPGISSVKALNDQNAVLGNTKVAPSFTTPGLPGAVTDVNGYKNLLGVVGQPVNTRISVDTSAALQAVHNFAAQASAALASFGGGSSLPAAPATEALPKVQHPKAPKIPSTQPDKLPPVNLNRPIVIHNNIDLDGRAVYRSVLDHTRRDLAGQ